jgi:hypothetical protein
MIFLYIFTFFKNYNCDESQRRRKGTNKISSRRKIDLEVRKLIVYYRF